MFMTDEEARTKWCPMGATRPVPSTTCCVAADCAMWRWQELQADVEFCEAVVKAAADVNDTSTARKTAAKHVMQNRAKYGLHDKPYRGWCGLAGKPEA